jgi:hypothetical protein
MLIHQLPKHIHMKIKYISRFLVVSLLCISAVSCSDSDDRKGFIDPNEELLVGLNEVKGYDHTYNYDFNILKTRENVEYYVPTSVSEGLSRIPKVMRDKLTALNIADLSFSPATQMSNIVTSWNDKNQLIFQLQLAYLQNADGYDTNFQDFFIVSVTQYPTNPFSDEEAKKELEDNLPQQYEILKLTDELPLYYLSKSDNNAWPRMFDYYQYNEKEKRIYKESTGSFKYYAWYDGLIYFIGCNMDTAKANPEEIVRKIILGS